MLAVSRRPWAAPAGAEQHIVGDYLETPAADVLVHLAEENSLQAAHQAGEEHLERSAGRLRGLERSGRFARIVYASSAAVYGDESPLPRRPDEPVEPRTIYARAKLLCEQVVLGAHGVALRFANIIGPGMSANSVLSQVLAQIPGGGDLRVRDDSVVRDFLWCGDMAACVAAVARSRVSGVFNVGSGQGCSVRELARLALAAAGESHRRVVSELQPARVSTLVLDIAATRAAFGWNPQVRLDAAVTEILESARV